jgi:hypothetical protein
MPQDSGEVAFALTARTRVNLALHHLLAACRGCAAIGAIEVAHKRDIYGPFWDEILHNALSVSALSVAALEAYANQLYCDRVLEKAGVRTAASQEIVALVDREQILSKYSLILSFYKDARLDRGSTPVQNADALIRLRNAVVHFQPEWFDSQDKHERLSKLLAYKFEPSPYLKAEPIFPRAWASHSFAVWALKTTVSFIDYFHAQIGTESFLEKWRARISELSAGAL